jgi:hypothetical protein
MPHRAKDRLCAPPGCAWVVQAREKIGAAALTTSQKKGLAAAALAAPFVVFVVSLLISPPVAGTLAGTTLSRLVDPIAIVALAGGLIVGAAGFKWWFAPLIGLGLGVVGVLMAYDFWLKVAGREAAGNAALQLIIWAVGFAGYGYLAGMLCRPKAVDRP